MNKMRRNKGLFRLTASVVMASLLVGCTEWKRPSMSLEQVIAEKQPDVIRVTRADFSVVELQAPRILGDSLIGETPGTANPHPRERLALPLSEIRMVEVRQVNGVKTALLIAGIGLTVLTVAAAASADGGSTPPPRTTSSGGGEYVSCPLVYSWDGEDWWLDSGTFGGAITRAAARTDLDNLFFARPDGGSLRLRLANELNETDHVDALHVLAVDHDPGVTVAPDGDGRIHTIGALTAPQSARDFRGRDVLARVGAADGWSWESVPTGRDTARLADVRDGLDLVFSKPRGASEARLVLDGHNTPWASYMMVEFVRAHGDATQAWYDSLDTQPRLMQQVGAMMAREAFLGVSVWSSGRWEKQAYFWEAGPEVVKRQVMRIDLSGVQGDVVRIRLESAPAFWLIDHVALDYSHPQPVTVHELSAERAIDRAGRDVRQLIASADERYYTMETGDQTDLTFRVPDVPKGMSRSYLVRSHGWYRIHTDERGEPDIALLSRIEAEPNAVSRISVARMNEALRALERAAR